MNRRLDLSKYHPVLISSSEDWVGVDTETACFFERVMDTLP